MIRGTYIATLEKSIGVKTKCESNYKIEVNDWLQDQMIQYSVKVEDFNKHPKKEGWFKAKNEAVTLTVNYKI